jgi:hypothetical protein
VAEDVAAPMNHAPLPGRKELGGAFGKPEAGVADNQRHASEPASFEMLEEGAPPRLVLLGALADAGNLPVAGEVRLKVPKLRQPTFETAVIERYRRRESSVEEALIEMYLAGVSVRRVEDITEARYERSAARQDTLCIAQPIASRTPVSAFRVSSTLPRTTRSR